MALFAICQACIAGLWWRKMPSVFRIMHVRIILFIGSHAYARGGACVVACVVRHLLTTKQPRLATYALWEARCSIVQCMHGYQRFHAYARGSARVVALLTAGRYIPKHSCLAA